MTLGYTKPFSVAIGLSVQFGKRAPENPLDSAPESGSDGLLGDTEFVTDLFHRDLPRGFEVAPLKGEYQCLSLCFGERLLGGRLDGCECMYFR